MWVYVNDTISDVPGIDTEEIPESKYKEIILSLVYLVSHGQ